MFVKQIIKSSMHLMVSVAPQTARTDAVRIWESKDTGEKIQAAPVTNVGMAFVTTIATRSLAVPRNPSIALIFANVA